MNRIQVKNFKLIVVVKLLIDQPKSNYFFTINYTFYAFQHLVTNKYVTN